MDVHLVVTRSFAGHAAGDLITDPALIQRLVDTHADKVVRVVPQPHPSQEA